jgi:hypothetical protein
MDGALMSPTDITKHHVVQKYVEPARQKGETTIEVRVGNVLKELGWSNRTPSVFSTLGSKQFQDEAGVELIEKRGGPASGGPSTTWQFIYRILDRQPSPSTKKENPVPNGAGLMNLAGICEEIYRQLGGGESFLKTERNWGPDAWERYAEQQEKNQSGGEGR